jgi:hypothetical protein
MGRTDAAFFAACLVIAIGSWVVSGPWEAAVGMLGTGIIGVALGMALAGWRDGRG